MFIIKLIITFKNKGELKQETDYVNHSTQPRDILQRQMTG